MSEENIEVAGDVRAFGIAKRERSNVMRPTDVERVKVRFDRSKVLQILKEHLLEDPEIRQLTHDGFKFTNMFEVGEGVSEIDAMVFELEKVIL